MEYVLTHTRSGRVSIPKGTAGYFSATNWGDTIEQRHGHKSLKRTKVFSHFKFAKSLDHKRWDKIIDGARAFYVERKRSVRDDCDNDIEVESDADIASCESE